MEEKLSCFGRCFLQHELGLLYTFMSGWMQIRKSFSNMQSLHCKHLPISQQLSWQYSCHTAEWVKQLPVNQCPDLNPIEIIWKIIGNKVMAKKLTTVTELWKRVEECTKIILELCEKLVMSSSGWTSIKHNQTSTNDSECSSTTGLQRAQKSPCYTSLCLLALATSCSSHPVQDTNACI